MVTKESMKNIVSNGLSISLIMILFLYDVFNNIGYSTNDADTEETKP